MPRMIGPGARNRAASRIASNCVLSPSSAKATTPAETRIASMCLTRGRNSRRARQPPPGDSEGEEIQAGAKEEGGAHTPIHRRQVADLRENRIADQRPNHKGKAADGLHRA